MGFPEDEISKLEEDIEAKDEVIRGLEEDVEELEEQLAKRQAPADDIEFLIGELIDLGVDPGMVRYRLTPESVEIFDKFVTHRPQRTPEHLATDVCDHYDDVLARLGLSRSEVEG